MSIEWQPVIVDGDSASSSTSNWRVQRVAWVTITLLMACVHRTNVYDALFTRLDKNKHFLKLQKSRCNRKSKISWRGSENDHEFHSETSLVALITFHRFEPFFLSFSRWGKHSFSDWRTNDMTSIEIVYLSSVNSFYFDFPVLICHYVKRCETMRNAPLSDRSNAVWDFAWFLNIFRRLFLWSNFKMKNLLTIQTYAHDNEHIHNKQDEWVAKCESF